MEYITLKLNNEELDTLTKVLAQEMVNIKIKQTKIEEERELTPEEEINFKKRYNEYQKLLRIIDYVRR